MSEQTDARPAVNAQVGKAAFIPCSFWLESEQKSVTRDWATSGYVDTSGLSSSDKMPMIAIQGGSNESYIVPAKAKNRAGGARIGMECE